MANDFVHLHCHTDYSLLDGACSINGLVDLADRENMRAVAITDHGNMFGAVEFYKKAKTTDVKPIVGMEAYIAAGSRKERSTPTGRPKYYHLVLLAKNETGYRNLIKLSSIGYLEGFYYRPRIDKEVLDRHSEGIVCLSACLQGEVCYHLARDQVDIAEEAIDWYKGVFGDDYYLEVQDHGIPEQQRANKHILKLAKKYDLKMIASNDSHYLTKQDVQAHDILLCIGMGTNYHDKNRFRFEMPQFYVKSRDEMARLFKDFDGALINTVEVAEKCNMEFDFDRRYLPEFKTPNGESSGEYFAQLCQNGVDERYEKVDDEVSARLKYEMDIIQQMGFVDYFLITQDFVQYAKNNGIPVGPGRGSAAGSIVAYALGITDVDPLKYDLLFERFLNAERVSMPDIDIDFSNEGRDEVIKYVTDTYGQERVAQIITFGTLAARGVLRDVGRVLEVPLSEVDKIAKLVPAKPGITLKKAFEEEPDLKKCMDEGDETIKQLFEVSQRLEGMSRHASTHAAGVVIGSQPLDEIVPLYKVGDDISTQYTMGILEELGLLKMDFLGLKTLSIIDKAIKLVAESKGVEIDVDTMPLDDLKTFEMLAKGDAKGVFQLESSGMREVLVKLKPDCFEDVIALLALYRPGPLGSGMVDTYIRVKHGEEEFKVLHPILEPILKETNGVILYQEQVMRIANKMAGFSLNHSDNLRKAMGKKKPEILAKFKQQFIDGAAENDVDAEIAEEMFNLIEYFAGYGFNKSHSTAYAFVTYQTAYLKANYPVEFMAALLTCEMGNVDKIVEYVDECRHMGITVNPPDIHQCQTYFTVRGKEIFYGLNAVKGVGERALDSIIEHRQGDGEYKSLFDLAERVDLRLCNKGVLENLIKSGAMDCLGANRNQMIQAIDQALRIGNNKQKQMKSGQGDLFGDIVAEDDGGDSELYPEVEEFGSKERLALEKEALGFFLSGHPVAKYRDLIKRYATDTLDKIPLIKEEQKVIVGGMLSQMKKIRDRKGNNMAFITMEDEVGSMEAVVFASVYEKVMEVLEADSVFFFIGKLSRRNPDSPANILLDDVYRPEDMKPEMAQNLTVLVHPETVTPPDLTKLKEILLRYGGRRRVYVRFLDVNGNGSGNGDGELPVIAVGGDFSVDVNSRLVADLDALEFIQGYLFNEQYQSIPLPTMS